MKDLWRKTAKLFLKHPILWLPYICAHILVVCLEWLRRIGDKRILSWCPTWHSVLGGHGYQACGSSSSTTMLLIHGTQWILDYLSMYLYATELLVIAVLIRMILRGEQPRLRTILEAIRTYPGRILVYSLKLLLLSLILTTLIGIPALHLSESIAYSRSLPHFGGILSRALLQGQAVLSGICYVWFMTPMAIRLLRPRDADSPSAEEKKVGRYFLILTVTTATAISGLFLSPLVRLLPLPSVSAQSAAANLLAPVLKLPELVGNIALAFLAVGGKWSAAEEPPNFNFRDLLQTLMPLHFGQGDDL